ncbi:digestive cysteine proteinase 2-like [Diabrotica undecimpunctata]|uniref:digestive cysteine proteinase 2-like n=1 Tax=Diabrotica undecimpunctata TaxID=50387 RepID=UPI003B63F68E
MISKFTLVFLACIVALAIGEPTVPEWSNTYSVEGIIYLPYAEIEEPFHAWYDGKSKNSRIDYYDGMVKTYQLGENGNGVQLKVIPFTTEDVLNQITCFQVNGTEDDSVTSQSILPDLEGFEYRGIDQLGNKEVEIWSLKTVQLEKENVYTLWVFRDEHGRAVPVKYDMKGYNSLLGSHYDHYYVTYHSYRIHKINPSVFEVETDSECRSFPGPGNQHVHIMNPMAEYIRPEKSEHVDSSFGDFINNHNKNYADAKEHAFRKEVFRQNVRFIESVNRRNKGYTLAINHLADKTDKEIKYLNGRVSSGGNNGGQPFPYTDFDTDNLPDEYDWRLYGAVSPVKDQAICGSCWSFGTVGTLEGSLFLKNGGKNFVRLSEQALVDCSWGFGNNGCDGGEDYRAYQWIQKHGGIPIDADYGNYLGEDGFCHADDVEKTAKITGWVNVTENDENALRLALFKQGPISVSIDASQKTFSFYSHGVYYDENCGNREQDLDHSVLAVGYGSINGENYWLIKNSWSTYWGDDGYILMSSKNNNCGVMTAATYVTM